jgi:hypothetical protein
MDRLWSEDDQGGRTDGGDSSSSSNVDDTGADAEGVTWGVQLSPDPFSGSFTSSDCWAEETDSPSSPSSSSSTPGSANTGSWEPGLGVVGGHMYDGERWENDLGTNTAHANDTDAAWLAALDSAGLDSAGFDGWGVGPVVDGGWGASSSEPWVSSSSASEVSSSSTTGAPQSVSGSLVGSDGPRLLGRHGMSTGSSSDSPQTVFGGAAGSASASASPLNVQVGPTPAMGSAQPSNQAYTPPDGPQAPPLPPPPAHRPPAAPGADVLAIVSKLEAGATATWFDAEALLLAPALPCFQPRPAILAATNAVLREERKTRRVYGGAGAVLLGRF